MELSSPEQRVVDVLLDHPNERVQAKTLAEVLECPEVKAREAVRSARLKGVLICSDRYGFFLPRTDSEAKATVHSLFSRVREIAKVARAVDAARERRFGRGLSKDEQIELVFGEEQFEEAIAS